MNGTRFRFIDFFSGIGMFRMAFERAGATCVYSVEIDKHKRRQYEIIFGHEPEADDIRTVDARNLPAAECWCAGFPCQNASIAGEKSGLAGDKTGLFFQLIRLLKELPEEDRPNYLLLENVRNLLSINKGFDFARVLTELDNCGYDVQWQVIDSKYFVPQHRERVFIVGCSRSKCSCPVLPIEIPVGKDDLQVKQVMQRDRPGRENLNQYRVYDPNGIAPTLTTAGGGGRNPYVFRIYATDRQTDRRIRVIGTTQPHRHSTGDVHDPSGIFPTILQRDYKQPRLIAVKIGGETDGR